MASELRTPGTPAWVQKLQDQGIQTVVGKPLQDLQQGGQALGTIEDSLVGEQGLAVANPPLYRFYGARTRMTGRETTSREYYHGIRSGLSKNYTGPGPVERVLSELSRGAALPAGAAGAALGGAVGSVIPGAGTTIGALAGRGLGMAATRGVANVLNPETADRSVLKDLAEAAVGEGLGRVAAMGIRRLRAAQAVRKGLLPGSAKSAVEETVLPAMPDIPPTTAHWTAENPPLPRRRLAGGAIGPEPPPLTDAEAAAELARWESQFGIPAEAPPVRPLLRSVERKGVSPRLRQDLQGAKTTVLPALGAMLLAKKAQAGSFDTKLSKVDEVKFQNWLGQASKAQDRNVKLDLQDYDLRGYWQSRAGKPWREGHLPDTFKKPNHPTFSNESIYEGALFPSGKIAHGGSWQGESFVAPTRNHALQWKGRKRHARTS